MQDFSGRRWWRPRRCRLLSFSCGLLALLGSARGPAAEATNEGSALPKKSDRVLTLEEAYRHALETDQTIRIAFYELRKANLAPWSALTRLGPSVNASSGYNRGSSTSTGRSTSTTLLSDGTVDTSSFNSSITSRSEARSGSISLSQPIFDFSVFPAYRYGKLAARAARMQGLYTVRQTLFTVASSYYAVLKDQSVVHVDEESVKLSQEQLDLAQTRFNAGVAARSDVLTARATLEDARRTLFQDRQTLVLDRNTLSNALNLGSDDYVLQEPTPASEEVKDYDYYLSQAFARREDYQVSKIAVEQDKALRDEVIAEYVPSVGASASSNLNSASGGSNTRSWSTGVSVSVPILNGGQREIDLRIAGHNIEESKLQLEQTSKSVQTDVKTTWEQVQTLRATISALKAEVEANEQNYLDFQTQYKVGSATSVDVQVALRDLNNSRSLLASQVYDYQVALRNLQRAAGMFESERIMKTNFR